MGGPELDPLDRPDDATKPLRSKLLAVPALRARYLGYVRQIATKWLDWNTVGPLAQRYQALIADDVRKRYAQARHVRSIRVRRERAQDVQPSAAALSC